MKKIVVLGGAGAMGQVIVKDLSVFATDTEIVIADFNKTKADDMAKKLNCARISTQFSDLHDVKQLARDLKGASVLVNSTPYYFNVPVMGAALEAGCHYMDLGGLFHVTREQQKLHDKFREKSLLAVLGMGAAPGMTNVMAAVGCDQLDQVETIDIVVGCIDFVDIDHPLATPYALDTILDEYTKEPMVFESGKFLAKPPMSGEKTINFADPVGICSSILTLHSEVATLPETYASKGVKNVTFRLGLPKPFHEKLKLLVDIGFGGKDPIEVEGQKLSPRKILSTMLGRFAVPDTDPDDCEIIRVDVIGRKDKERKLVRLETTVFADKEWKVSCGALDTGVPPAIVARMLVDGQIEDTGVLPPEVCVPAKQFFKELSKRTINIGQEIMQAPEELLNTR